MPTPLLRVWNVQRYAIQAETAGLTFRGGAPVWKNRLRQECRRLMWQNTRDQKRRGQTNREGARNRSFRRHTLP